MQTIIFLVVLPVLNNLCNGVLLDNREHYACYADIDIPNSIDSIPDNGELILDHIFDNNDHATNIFCLWYNNHISAEKASDEKLRSNEIMAQISSNNIISTNYQNTIIKCDGKTIKILESQIQSSHLCANECNDSICHRFLNSASSVTSSHNNHLNIPNWLFPTGGIILGSLLIIIIISFIIFIKTRSKKTLNENDSKKYIEKTMKDVIDNIAKYTIGDADDDDIDTNDYDSSSSPIILGRNNNININSIKSKLNNINIINSIDSNHKINKINNINNMNNNNDNNGCNSVLHSIESHTMVPKLDISNVQMSVSSSENEDDNKRYYSDDIIHQYVIHDDVHDDDVIHSLFTDNDDDNIESENKTNNIQELP